MPVVRNAFLAGHPSGIGPLWINDNAADRRHALRVGELCVPIGGGAAIVPQMWAHFLSHEAPRVAKLVAEALPAPLEKAMNDDPDKTNQPQQEEDTSVEDAIDAARLLARVPAATVPAAVESAAASAAEDAVDYAVGAMPWPSVQATTETVLQEQALGGVKDGVDAILQIAGIQLPQAKAPNVFRMANPRAVAWAEQHAAELIKGVDDTTRASLNRLIVQAQREGWSMQQTINRITADYTFSKERASTIARTELKRSSVAGNIESMRATAKTTGITIFKRVILGMNENHCVACSSAVAEGAIPLDDSWAVGFAPPFHPSCYCSIVPVPQLKSDKPEV